MIKEKIRFSNFTIYKNTLFFFPNHKQQQQQQRQIMNNFVSLVRSIAV